MANSDSPEEDLKSYVRATLLADATLNGLVAGVYTNVPDNVDFPYIRINPIASRDESLECIEVSQYDLTLVVFSRSGGFDEGNRIRRLCYKLLKNGSGILDHFALSTIDRIGEQESADPDGATTMSILRMTCEIEEPTQ